MNILELYCTFIISVLVLSMHFSYERIVIYQLKLVEYYCVDDGGDVVERISEALWVGPVAVAKAWVVWSYQMIVIPEPGEERLKHS